MQQEEEAREGMVGKKMRHKRDCVSCVKYRGREETELRKGEKKKEKGEKMTCQERQEITVI